MMPAKVQEPRPPSGSGVGSDRCEGRRKRDTDPMPRIDLWYDNREETPDRTGTTHARGASQDQGGARDQDGKSPGAKADGDGKGVGTSDRTRARCPKALDWAEGNLLRPGPLEELR